MNLFATLFDVQRYCVHDGPGIRTVVFMKGCPLRCLWCHNPEGLSPEPETVDGILKGRRVTISELVTEVLRDKPFFDESGGGVTVSGGEPLMQADFTAAFLAACRKAGLHTAIETCGESTWEKFRAVLEQSDLLLFDLKHMDSAEHRRLTGAPNERILSNLLKFRVEFATPLIVRIPVVPGFNDSEENIRRTTEFVAPLHPQAVHLLPYNRLAQDKYERMGLPYQSGNLPVPPAAEMAKLKTIVEQSGVLCDIS